MPSDKPRVDGVVEAARGNGFFTVLISLDGQEPTSILCQLSGKMRTNNIKVVGGDRVDVELDPLDMKKGRIIYRKR